jgi:hypothetical protein
MLSSRARDPPRPSPSPRPSRAWPSVCAPASAARWSPPATPGPPTPSSPATPSSVFREAALRTRPMPTHPHMRAVWEPARQALLKALRGDRSPADALEEGRTASPT